MPVLERRVTGPQRHYESSAALCRAVLETTGPTCLLSFSGGKDAIAAWLRLREVGFSKVVPFYYYLVPGLEFVERSLTYYEEFFRTPILRLPSPELARMLSLDALVFQPPERVQILEAIGPMPRLKHEDLEEYVRKVNGLPANTYCALGTRTADSPIRYANVKRYGSLNPRRRTFLPVYDWRIADVVGALKEADVRLSPEYKWFGRTFDGLDARFLGPIKEHAPRDYQRILDFYPMAELELFRRTLGGPDAPQASVRPSVD